MARKKNKTGTAGSSTVALPGNMTRGTTHPIMLQAVASGARLDRGTFEVAEVANPFGEVIIRGEMRRHKAVRRVPHFELLYRSNVIDRAVFACLEWYDARLAAANTGMIKCGLDVSGGGGGSPQHHIPLSQTALEGRSDVAWARGHIPDNDLRLVFDGVMEDGDTFEVIGARVYPQLCLDRAKRRASTAFKIAANHLLLGVGARVCGVDMHDSGTAAMAARLAGGV